MTKIKIEESKTGTFLIRHHKELDQNLTYLFDKLNIDFSQQTRMFVDILMTVDNRIFYFDYDDFKDVVFKCTFFEFQYILKEWLTKMNIPENKWVRVDILVA